MTKPHWETILEMADRLASGGVATKRDIQDLRGAAYQMDLWFTAVQELREECEAARLKRHEHDKALQIMAFVLSNCVVFARQEITLDAFATGVRDKAGFKNIMATAYGLDSVGAPLPPKKTRKAKEVKA